MAVFYLSSVLVVGIAVYVIANLMTIRKCKLELEN